MQLLGLYTEESSQHTPEIHAFHIYQAISHDIQVIK